MKRNEFDAALLVIVERLSACAARLSAAPTYTESRANDHVNNCRLRPEDRPANAVYHQVGQLEQICHNEAAALECHIKLLRALVGVES